MAEQVVMKCEPVVVTQAAANTQLFGVQLVGALCSTAAAGTLTITDSPPSGTRTLVNATPLVAGAWYVIPFQTQGTVTITVGGTGSVTVGYN